MIHAFRGLRYTQDAGPAADVVTHPYDKIGPADLARFRNRSPFSAVHLIRGESGPDDRAWYANSRRLVDAWQKTGILKRDSTPAFYLLRQRFKDHAGAPRCRTALIGALDLRERARVFPHEKTHARAREDRFLLLTASEMHYGLVFLLKAGGPRLDPSVLEVPVTARVAGLEDADHEFHVIDDPERVRAIAASLAAGPYVIADGHHRFATACRYADGNPAARSVLVGVVDVEDPDLVVLPTHRLLFGLDRSVLHARLAGLGARAFDASQDPWTIVAQYGPGTIGLLGPKGVPALLWNPKTAGMLPEEALDVAALDRELVRPLLEGKDAEDHLSYHRDPMEALRILRGDGADLLALLAPISPVKVVDIATRRAVMPQKSTDFYPKLPTGFVYLPAIDFP